MIVPVAASMVVLIGMASLTIDLGILYVARTQAQASADAAAMAGAWKLLDESRLRGELTQVMSNARDAVVNVAYANEVIHVHPLVDRNDSNDPSGDLVIGYLADPSNFSESMGTTNPDLSNSVLVRIRRDTNRNSPINLYFSGIFGRYSANMLAQATATFRDGVIGYRVTDRTGNAELLPFTLHVDSWNGLLAGTVTNGDNYSYDPDTGTVSAGPDGILELNLYPGAGVGQLPPGNFGTVDIGPPNNSTSDLSRQIRYGVSAQDLAYFGGELRLNNGHLILNGDTGLSAGVKDDLMFIKGLPRAIPLFNAVSGPGNNANFTIVAFAGIRIMNVQLTGAMSKKNVIIQPAYVVDDAVITQAHAGTSYFVYEPVRLSR